MQTFPRLRVLGGGRIGQLVVKSALLKGFSKEKIAISVAHPSPDRNIFGIPTRSTQEVVFESIEDDIVCLAVKPKQLPALMTQIAGQLHPRSTIVSTVPGFSEKYLTDSLWGRDVVRVMPSILNADGMGRLIAYRAYQSQKHKQMLGSLFPSRIIRWVPDEKILELMTILNGCLPGWFAKLSESVFEYSRQIGIPEDLSREVIGSAMNGTGVSLTQISPEELQSLVATPEGVTELGLLTLDQEKVPNGLRKSLKAMTIKLMNGQRVNHSRKSRR